MKHNKNQSGFLIIETLIAILVVTMVILSLYSAIAFLQLRSTRSKHDSQGSLLLQEGVEIAHNALLSDWEGYLYDTEYHPAYDALYKTWILVDGEETGLQTRFARKITLHEVCREANGEKIDVGPGCPGYTQDSNSKIVEAVISWEEAGNVRSHTARLLIFNKGN